MKGDAVMRDDEKQQRFKKSILKRQRSAQQQASIQWYLLARKTAQKLARSAISKGYMLKFQIGTFRGDFSTVQG